MDYWVKDPRSGSGRKRGVDMVSNGGCAKGTVFWGSSVERGVVNVGTSLAPVALNV